MNKKKIVIALGGNALLRGDQAGTIEEQEKNTYDTLKNIIPFIKEGHDVILSHGNGPQVGNILMRNDAGCEMYDIPQMPLDICVADSQGGIGYMIERIFRNILTEEGINKDVVTLVTQTLVKKDDPAFNNPTKRVGKIYPKVQADKLAKEKGWKFKESPKLEAQIMVKSGSVSVIIMTSYMDFSNQLENIKFALKDYKYEMQIL